MIDTFKTKQKPNLQNERKAQVTKCSRAKLFEVDKDCE